MFLDPRDHLSKKKGQIPKPVHPSGLDKLHRYWSSRIPHFGKRNPERKLLSGKRSSTSSSILAGYLLTDPSTSFKVKTCIKLNLPQHRALSLKLNTISLLQEVKTAFKVILKRSLRGSTKKIAKSTDLSACNSYSFTYYFWGIPHTNKSVWYYHSSARCRATTGW